MKINTPAGEEGARLLLRTIISGSINKTYDDEGSELMEFLSKTAYLNLKVLSDLGNDNRKNYTHIRYLAALLFDKENIYDLAKSIHFILDNDNLMIGDIQNILYGSKRDVDIKKIQKIGELLHQGNTFLFIAEQAGVSYDTVERIENFLGINESLKQKQISMACDAIAHEVSIRDFAKQINVSKSTAHLIYKKARSVLQELGEIR
jgi:hypothetical protein